MNKKILRRKLLKQMCRCAEEISTWCSEQRNPNIQFIEDYCPRAFKPGTNDIYLFNRILDKVIDSVHAEIEEIRERDFKRMEKGTLFSAKEIIESRNRQNSNYYSGRSKHYYLVATHIMAKHYWPYYGEWMKVSELNGEKGE
ncbi:MAG: hypothetical protein WC781_03490 [Candidatus Pacearchaeota archaeon]|jgi:hypothetical protein